ncbi:MAG TPA: choice-of-anchor tandem repeat GloVer-containing protein [Candidatus Limnocylindrales bacterium]|nr:choice-of-anchor tandem repeat GloVer-containing protein [Candidatus Limnocylindrales bacterium]
MKTTNTKWFTSVSLTKLSLVAIGMFLAAASSALAQPVITIQPTNHFMNASGPVTFSVAASGTGLTYQWLFNGTSLTSATSSTLSLAAPQPTNWGYYSVIVTNASGSITSQVAELKVFVAAPHNLSGIQVEPGGSASLSFTGETTVSFAPYYDLYPLEGSSNLMDWAPLATLQRTNTALDTLRFADTDAPQFSQRFYRTPTNALLTPDPQPTGPYPVGTFSMELTNSRRSNAKFMVTFWYPAVAQAGFLPVKYEDPQAAVPANYGKFSSQAAAFFSHSLSNAPLATNLSVYPVVLYDPGATGDRRENTAMTEDLASWGYVVVSLDPADATISVFPDGTVVYGQTLPPTIAGYVAAIEGRLLDMEFVLDELESLNAGDPRFGGRLDLANIGAFGFSLGGCTTAQLCLRDPRCKAGVGIDAPYLETNLLTQPLGRPWLYFRSDLDPDPAAWFMGLPGGVPDDRLQVYNEQATNAYWVKLASTVHGSFADWDLIVDSATLKAQFTTSMSGQFLPPVRVSQIRRAYLLSFFNKHLRGEDDHLLDGPSPAYPEVLQFLSKSGSSVPPEYPSAALVQGSDGNLYGTTGYGGANNEGTVIQVTTNGTLTTLVSFNGTNGSYPFAGLVQGNDDNFYGTTEYGGTNGNHGTVFQMTPAGALTTLVSFNGTNGSYPTAALVQGSDGNFYGTTQSGGASGMGTVFEMTSSGVLTTLVSFNNTDGSVPLAGLVQGTNGNFYGTTFQGGDLSIDGLFNNSGAGTVFEMTPAGVLTTLVVFNGYDGANPAGGLVQGTNGNLYGTTSIGGNVSLNAGWGFGTVFKMTPGGAMTTLVSFNLTNGYNPTAGLVQGSDGNFYGTTDGGGAGGCGTVFKMTPAGVLTTLVSFNGTNGNNPQATLVQGSDGNLYGTTEYGGANGLGTVLQVTTNGTLTTLVSF